MDRLRYLRGTLYEYGMLDATTLDGTQPCLGTRPGQQRLRGPTIYGKLVALHPDDFHSDYDLKEIELGRSLTTVAGSQA